MNKIILGVGILALLFVGLYFNTPKEEASFGASIGGTITNSATSTASSLPVMVLDSEAQREYAAISNNSDTDIFLHLGYFASGEAASTTVAVNEGILLNADDTWETREPFLYKGQIWATSTAASKVITFTEIK